MRKIFRFAPAVFSLALCACASIPGPAPLPAGQASPPAAVPAAPALLHETPHPPAAPVPSEPDTAVASESERRTESDNSIYFAIGGTLIDPAGQQKIREHATRLQENSEQVIQLIGHSDNLGSRGYNLAISEKRIEAVRALLRSYGVSKKQILTYALGNERADRNCKTSACRLKMRRVELIYPK